MEYSFMGDNEHFKVKGSVHDIAQLELDFDYPLLSSSEEFDEFEIDLYFFIPKNLGVGPSSYPRERFYNDLTNYLRFHTPEAQAPLLHLPDSLLSYFDNNKSIQDREQFIPYLTQQVKIFGNQINKRMKDLHSSIFNGPENLFQNYFDIKKNIEQIEEDVRYFRKKYVEKCRISSLGISNNVQESILNTDEFIINRTISCYSDILRIAESLDTNFSGIKELKALLNQGLHEESKYRDQYPQQYTGPKKTKFDLEYFNYRHGLLKKFLARPLHIQIKSLKQERVYRNWIAGAGAALAGFWAHIAELQAHQLNSSKDIGLSVITVGLVAILVYVFKDRIKDLSKEYFNEKLKSHLPDYKVALTYDFYHTDLKKYVIKVGLYKDFFRFLNFKTCPEDIIFIRKMINKRNIMEENLESIIHYNRVIRINQKEILEKISHVKEIKDIIRLNFNYLLDHMDDYEKKISYFDYTEGASKNYIPKVYHVNLICRLKNKDKNTYIHYRIIIDKRGISRLEEIAHQIDQPFAMTLGAENNEASFA